MNNITPAARLRKLENSAGHEDGPTITVDWDETPDSELEPGTLVIEWGENDEFISYRVPSDGKKKHNNPH